MSNALTQAARVCNSYSRSLTFPEEPSDEHCEIAVKFERWS